MKLELAAALPSRFAATGAAKSSPLLRLEGCCGGLAVTSFDGCRRFSAWLRCGRCCAVSDVSQSPSPRVDAVASDSSAATTGTSTLLAAVRAAADPVSPLDSLPSELHAPTEVCWAQEGCCTQLACGDGRD